MLRVATVPQLSFQVSELTRNDLYTGDNHSEAKNERNKKKRKQEQDKTNKNFSFGNQIRSFHCGAEKLLESTCCSELIHTLHWGRLHIV
jgi:fructose-1,6-bisphosphatase/inositol monophosphatase family enzyme